MYNNSDIWQGSCEPKKVERNKSPLEPQNREVVLTWVRLSWSWSPSVVLARVISHPHGKMLVHGPDIIYYGINVVRALKP